MTVTVLAILFLLVIILLAFFGYKGIVRRGVSPAERGEGKCSLCRESFPNSELIIRQVGDHRLLSFCRKCILSLHADLGMKN